MTFISSAYLLAPFWSDVDIGFYGSIFYEVHNNSNSLLISQVNQFLSNYTETDFNGTWMLVVQWDEVRQFPGILTIPVRCMVVLTILVISEKKLNQLIGFIVFSFVSNNASQRYLLTISLSYSYTIKFLTQLVHIL